MMQKWFFVAAGLALASAQPISAQTLVALTGKAAPSGGNYSSFTYSPNLSPTGSVAFFANLSGGTSIEGLFAGAPGSLQTVLLQGNPAPTGGGTYFETNAYPVINGSGQVAFYTSLSGGSAGTGIFSGAPGAIQTVCLTGTAAPSGGNVSGLNEPALNSAGQVAFLCSLTGGTATQGIFSGFPGALATVALQGLAAPAGGNYQTLNNSPAINASGEVAFQTSLTGGTAQYGIFAGTPGSLATVALQGSAAPSGGTYNSPSQPDINSAGKMAFNSTLNGTASAGVFTGTPGNITTVALAGTAAPAGGNYLTFYGSPLINGRGTICFKAALTGGSATQGIFVGQPGGIQAAAIQGAAAPAGGNYSTFGNPVLNGSDQVAFVAGVTNGINTQGLFAGTPGNMVDVVLTGQVINVSTTGGTDDRTVNGILLTFGSGGQDGYATSFDDAGLLTYELSFTDGSTGMFTTEITPTPEPAFLLLAGFGGIIFVRRLR